MGECNGNGELNVWRSKGNNDGFKGKWLGLYLEQKGRQFMR